MAQRYGGKFSPDNSTHAPGTIPRARPGDAPGGAGVPSSLMFIAPLPLAVRAFWQTPVDLAVFLAAFGVLILGAWLTRTGLLAEAAFNARKVARRPAFPRKLFGAAATGAGLYLAGFAAGSGLFAPLAPALVGAVLHVFAFGPDPLHDKGMEGIDSFQSDRVARVVDEGEKHLAAMSDAILRTKDRALSDRVAAFQITARDMFRTVENDPRDLTAARKYLGVYLKGARDATVKFTDLYERTKDTHARADYEALLSDLEENFAARTRTLLLDDRSDLDVEIEVLRERLEREGLPRD